MTTGRKWAVLAVLILIPAACAAPNSAGLQSTATDPLSVLVRFYQGPLDHLSAVRRGQCFMYPSCSQYSKQAVSKHGALLGWFMTTDRLMRCGRDEMRLSPPVLVNGERLYYDPIEVNDSWLTGGRVQSPDKVR